MTPFTSLERTQNTRRLMLQFESSFSGERDAGPRSDLPTEEILGRCSIAHQVVLRAVTFLTVEARRL